MDREKKSCGCTRGEAYYSPTREDPVYFGADKIIEVELDSIRERREQHSPPKKDANLETKDLCGLALSGGGIRSASFSLGVMQALAHNGWLAEIDYLSTVSGGGYIGSSLTWALNTNSTFGLSGKDFPFASFPMSGEPRDVTERTPLAMRSANEKTKWSGRLLNFLRQNAKYLNPGKGLNLFALVWTALRGASMGLLVYGALVTLLFLIAFQTHFFLEEVCRLSFLPRAMRLNGFLLVAGLGFGLCALTLPLYSVATYAYQWVFREKTYQFRRLYERLSGWILPWLVVFLVLGLVPLAHNWVDVKGEARTSKAGRFAVSGNLASDGALSFKGSMNTTVVTNQPTPSRPTPCASPCPEAPPPVQGSLWANVRDNIAHELWRLGAGLGAILIGLLSGITVFFKTKSIKPGRVPIGFLVSLGVAGLLFGVALFAYTIAYAVVASIGCSNPVTTWRFICIGAAATLFFAIVTNINHISIHRYYRDRLMETFLPEIDYVLNGDYSRATESPTANIKPLHKMSSGPYHIINTNVVLVSSEHPKFRVRGGDNFILTPKYCGSYATGWRCTESFVNGTMTLASAMAVSGAALNPSAGCGGEGITRSPFLSMLMGLLNLRLGCWVPNPNPAVAIAGLKNPNFILPGLWEVAFRNRLNEKGMFLQLSDGGHFENLGLYELVRRKLKLIIVCDGGADPKFTFSDLSNAMEKVRVDFGALIMIDNNDLEALIPKKDDEDKDEDAVLCARQGHLVATIKYADNTMGTLIYLTTTFFKGVTADLYGYKKENPAFPDESTGDQFFDEKQFEAYRELGFQAAWNMMRDDKAISRV